MSAGIWIADPEGVKAVVATQQDRDYWAKVQGWTDAEAPTGQDRQWVRHTVHGGKGALNAEAAALHAELGWAPCGPPGYDEPAPAPAMKTATKAAPAAGDKKE